MSGFGVGRDAADAACGGAERGAADRMIAGAVAGAVGGDVADVAVIGNEAATDGNAADGTGVDVSDVTTDETGRVKRCARGDGVTGIASQRGDVANARAGDRRGAGEEICGNVAD